ncbi:hypothetical protein ATKI12_5514 [Kitasatospora sp. Ki12]
MDSIGAGQVRGAEGECRRTAGVRWRRYLRMAGISALRGASSAAGAAAVSGALWWLGHR